MKLLGNNENSRKIFTTNWDLITCHWKQILDIDSRLSSNTLVFLTQRPVMETFFAVFAVTAIFLIPVTVHSLPKVSFPTKVDNCYSLFSSKIVL